MRVITNLSKYPKLAEGGEGIIYDLGSEVLKVYKADQVDVAAKEKKIGLLLQKKLPANVVGPIEAVSDGKKFIGFTMRKITNAENFNMLTNRKHCKINNITIKDILGVLEEIRETLTLCHPQRVFVGDLNDLNMLLVRDADNKLHVLFVDVDSWTIEDCPCQAILDEFKDPLMKRNSQGNAIYNAETDSYAYAIASFKNLVRVNPFCGNIGVEMSQEERMKRGLSVIDRAGVILPPVARDYRFMSPTYLADLRSIFEQAKRFLPIQSFDDFKANLKLCTVHNDYYYGKYNECPVCSKDAKVQVTPQKVAVDGQIPYLLLGHSPAIKLWLTRDTYISINGMVVNDRVKKSVKFTPGNRYYLNEYLTVSTNDDIISISADNFQSNIKKAYKSKVQLLGNKVYYVNPSFQLTEFTLGVRGNSERSMGVVSINNMYEVVDEKNYFICNFYDTLKIINVNGFNHMLSDKHKIRDYAIHYDVVTKHWLFIYSDGNRFRTYVFDNNKIVYQSEDIGYSTNLSDICFYNDTIFSPIDGAIRAFSFAKNIYKDFPCPIIDGDSNLTRVGPKFVVINEKEVYEVG